jgi:hypothetical protein
VLAGKSFDATIDCAAYDGAGVEALGRTAGFSPGRYVTISTGQVCLVTTAPSMPYREEDADHPLRPEPPPDTYEHRSWSYGVKKRAMEAAALDLAERAGWDVTILRLPVVLGAGDTSLRTWAWLERFLDGGPVLLPDGGERQIRFLWADDVARAGRASDRATPAEPGLPSRSARHRHAAHPGRDAGAARRRRAASRAGRSRAARYCRHRPRDPAVHEAAGYRCWIHHAPNGSGGSAARRSTITCRPSWPRISSTVRMHTTWAITRAPREIELARRLESAAR